MACIFPTMVPLTHKAGYPSNPQEIKERVAERFKLNDLKQLMKKTFKCVMIFSNPYMYEPHIQIVSDALISKNGILGTVRAKSDPQYPKLYYAHEDLLIPHKDPELPIITQRFSLGAYTRCFDTIFKK